MKCPKCGFEQPESPECLSCGIIIAKFQKPPADVAAPTERPVAPPAAEAEPNPLLEPIGGVARVVRFLAGLVCAANAVIMYLNGSALATFSMYAVLVFFVGAFLYTLVTVVQRVSIRQFAIEMMVLVAFSIGVKLVYPQIFDLEYQEAPPATPGLKSEYAEVVKRTELFETAVRAYVKAPIPAEAWPKLEEHLSWLPVRTQYQRLKSQDRVAAYPLYNLAQQVGVLVAESLPKGAAAGSGPPPPPTPEARTRIVTKLDELHNELEAFRRSQVETQETAQPGPDQAEN